MIEFVAIKGGSSIDSLKWKSDTLWHSETIIGMDSLLRDSTNINLNSIGWIQGKKRTKPWQHASKSNHYWVIDPNKNTPPAHIHLSDYDHTKHAHDHHIYNDLKKQRRFAIRCVKLNNLITKPKLH